MLILLDMDGPLADLEKGMLDNWRRLYPRAFFVPVEKRTSFYPTDDYPKRLHGKLTKMCSAPGFFLNLRPTPGALSAVKKMLALGLDVRICTSPFLSYYENCISEKYQWVEFHLGRKFLARIIQTSDKTLVRGDVLIDDKPDITGSLQPTWKHVIFEAPYNQHIKDKRRLDWSNWRKVLNV